ncbi:MAG: hypothetical protein IPN71_21905 [Fibrobacteres bacterium]|nr:hypothetical protein [Fibrobacterota bacterium]
MRFSVTVLALLGFGALVFTSCGPKPDPDLPVPPPPTVLTSGQDTPIAPPPVAPTKPAGMVDSTGDDPRPVVVVEKLGFAGVRTRLIPHVMGRGWALSVNKSDSIEFIRAAEPELSHQLFGVIPEAGTKVRLRFRLSSSTGKMVRIEVCSHLIARTGQMPYRANVDMLTQSLEEMKVFLSTAPSGGGIVIDRVRKK